MPSNYNFLLERLLPRIIPEKVVIWSYILPDMVWYRHIRIISCLQLAGDTFI